MPTRRSAGFDEYAWTEIDMGGISCWIAGGNSVIASILNSDAALAARAALAGCTSYDRIVSFLAGATAPCGEFRVFVVAGSGTRGSAGTAGFRVKGDGFSIGGGAPPHR